MNHTELRQRCQALGLHTHPSATKEELERTLLAEQPPQRDPVNNIRDGIMRYLLKHWSVVRGQLSCPAKSGDPHACYGCPDSQVAYCVVQQAPSARSEMETK